MGTLHTDLMRISPYPPSNSGKAFFLKQYEISLTFQLVKSMSNTVITQSWPQACLYLLDNQRENTLSCAISKTQNPTPAKVCDSTASLSLCEVDLQGHTYRNTGQSFGEDLSQVYPSSPGVSNLTESCMECIANCIPDHEASISTSNTFTG